MRIINLCVRDWAGVAYNLSHAINKHTKHKAINLRSTRQYMNYPVIAEMRDYPISECKKIVEKADVIVYHGAVLPFYEVLNLNPKKLEDKKKLLYFRGSEMRGIGADIIKQATEILGEFQICVATPDLLTYDCLKGTNAKWLPGCRSFSEISRKRVCNQDRRALRSFTKAKRRVVFTHAPTSEKKKGSPTFYRVITQLMKGLPYLSFLTIRNQPWDTCLRMISMSDVLFDSDAPFPFAYGAVSLEASIFKIPVVTRISNDVIKIIKDETGLKSPFITFSNEDDLLNKAFQLAEDEEVRKLFGNMVYEYCKRVHDTKPVAERFLEIVEEMA